MTTTAGERTCSRSPGELFAPVGAGPEECGVLSAAQRRPRRQGTHPEPPGKATLRDATCQRRGTDGCWRVARKNEGSRAALSCAELRIALLAGWPTRPTRARAPLLISARRTIRCADACRFASWVSAFAFGLFAAFRFVVCSPAAWGRKPFSLCRRRGARDGRPRRTLRSASTCDVRAPRTGSVLEHFNEKHTTYTNDSAKPCSRVVVRTWRCCVIYTDGRAL